MSKSYDKLRKRICELELRMTSLAGLGCIPSISCTAECAKEQQYTEDKNMDTFETNNYDSERYSLREAVYSTTREKDKELRKKYNIDCEEPNTAKGVVAAIQNGKFKYKEEGKHADDPSWYCSPFNGICFCDPGKEPDYVGYQASKEKMEEDSDDILLEISVLEPEKALKSYKNFKERTYH